MTLSDFAIIACTQLVLSFLAAAVLYRMLRGKFKSQQERMAELQRKLSETRAHFSERTRGLGVLQPIREDLQRAVAVLAKVDASMESDVSRLRLVILTLPKVGSVSVARMLRTALPCATVEHMHAISLEGQQALAADIVAMNMGKGRDDMLRHLHRSMVLRPELDALLANRSGEGRVFFICGTREPIALALSLLFQMIGQGIIAAGSQAPDAAKEWITNWLSESNEPHWVTRPRTWIERELAGFLGVNPLGQPFDYGRGYQVMNTKRGRFLLFRYENFDQMPHALAELLLAPHTSFELARENVGADKPAGVAYQQLAATLKFPRAFVEQVYAEPYATTFYTADERRAFVERWSEL
jgi:hypothetical protein